MTLKRFLDTSQPLLFVSGPDNIYGRAVAIISVINKNMQYHEPDFPVITYEVFAIYLFQFLNLHK